RPSAVPARTGETSSTNWSPQANTALSRPNSATPGSRNGGSSASSSASRRELAARSRTTKTIWRMRSIARRSRAREARLALRRERRDAFAMVRGAAGAALRERLPIEQLLVRLDRRRVDVLLHVAIRRARTARKARRDRKRFRQQVGCRCDAVDEP